MYSVTFRRLCLGGLFGLVLGAALYADWFRNFGDNTVQGLQEFDITEVYSNGAIDEFGASAVNQSLRMQFHGLNSNDDSAIMYDSQIFGDLSTTVLIRFSTNPHFLTQPNSSMNGGVMVRLDLNTVSGYLLIMNDRSFLQLLKIQNGAPIWLDGLDVTGFHPSQDWWIRLEGVELSGGSYLLRGRAWQDGTPEPLCDWLVQYEDTNPLPPNITGLLANEDQYGNGQYIDLDNVSVTDQLVCWEYCDNGIDDDLDGDTDCQDSDCANYGSCQCNEPFADLDGDSDVDQVDFAQWQRCYTGEDVTPADPTCACLDRDEIYGSPAFEPGYDGDGDIDGDDLSVFILCVSGPQVPADPSCDD